ncbi:hypothetical protein H1C71_021598 [Ictidomys tridecemlineatus]|nr:hypothetical protein H1C71_021598 [Ictidomys tridecemlineatus]KAG3268600.1 hypothetical protein H1C71_021598 [Ictidomys tridecemlineatus]
MHCHPMLTRGHEIKARLLQDSPRDPTAATALEPPGFKFFPSMRQSSRRKDQVWVVEPLSMGVVLRSGAQRILLCPGMHQEPPLGNSLKDVVEDTSPSTDHTGPLWCGEDCRRVF